MIDYTEWDQQITAAGGLDPAQAHGVHTGAAAARTGKEWLARAGRPSLGADHATGAGRSRKRQVRLDGDLDDWLATRADETGTSPSEMMRAALREYRARCETGKAA